ncbi:MAG: beta-ketoacyl-[acyl-carrier-protein] synthase family protein [Candidatus Eiseniibacteriota bacterium]
MSTPDPTRVVVTGIGAVTPFGVGRDALLEGLRSARSTARTLPGREGDEAVRPFACPVDDAKFDPTQSLAQRKSIKLMSRATTFAVAAAALALDDARLRGRLDDPARAGVVLGTGGVGLHDADYLATMLEVSGELIEGRPRSPEPGGGASTSAVAVAPGIDLLDLAARHMNPLTPLKLLPNMAAAHVAIEQGLRGENLTVCTACTSGTQAVGEAVRLLRLGRADVMLAGGTDAMINPMGLIGFSLLGVLSRRFDDPVRAARPFDLDRDGFVMGEGAAILVLETAAHAVGRGARILAEIAGYASCSDAYRVTDEREDGSGCVQAIRGALADAAVRPADVDYVNAHGTGTLMNDRTEVRALREVLGAHLDRVPVSSTKSQIGHLIAAAGAVELAACVLALEHQFLPPTINYETPDPECAIDVVPNVSRPAAIRTVLSNSFGFGGQNACLVVRGWDV